MRYEPRHAKEWWTQVRLLKLQFVALIWGLSIAMFVLLGILVRDVIL